MMKSSIRSILNIIRVATTSLAISSSFLFACSPTPEEHQSQALIDEFTYKEFYQNRPQWELKAHKAEVFSSTRAKIKDLIVELKAPQFPLSFQSKKGTLGEKGMTMQVPVSVQIPEHHLKMTLLKSAQWNREKQHFIGQDISLKGQSFQGTGQSMTLNYPYETLQLSSVTFKFERD